MKTKTIAVLAALGLLPITGFSQTPPPPPSPPNPPGQPNPPLPPPRDHDNDRAPKIPVTFLGVETSEVPRVVSEQLGLAKGFGLVVDYVVPDGPAAAAGVQQNDIIKMLNDQILVEPDQLAKLVRSYPEGTSVTLTILRKGAETKVTAKLAKREVPDQRHFFGPGFDKHMKHGHGPDMGELNQEMQYQFPDMNLGPTIRDAVRDARREALRASVEARRAARQINIMSTDKGAVKSTKIDLAKAQIVFSDVQGEMKIETVDGKKMLTAKDPQGRLLFSGPIETKEDLDKVPAEVRQRYDKLEQKDLPGMAPTAAADTEDDAEDMDNDKEDDGDMADDPASTQEVSFRSFPRASWSINAVLI